MGGFHTGRVIFMLEHIVVFMPLGKLLIGKDNVIIAYYSNLN